MSSASDAVAHGPRLLVIPLSLALLSTSCSHELDTTRVTPARGTLGEEIYEVVCQRIASEEDPTDVSGRRSKALCDGRVGPEAATTPRLRALAENRDRLVTALDRVMPDALHDDLRGFMVQIVPFYDPPEERLPRQTRAAAALIEKLVEDDEALTALQRMSHRRGYRALRQALGLARPMLSYPRFDELARTTLATIEEDGPAGPEWQQLLRALALEMATAEPAPPHAVTNLALTQELMFTTDPAFGTGRPRWAVRRDDRGLVMVSLYSGVVPAPFVDRDGDGLADVDGLGRFVDGSSGPLAGLVSPFAVPYESGVARDAHERALRSDGSHIYQYVDVDETMLAGVAREAAPLLRPETTVALDLAYGLPALLGPEASLSEVYGAETLAYDGYDTRAGALFDVLHGLGSVLHREELADALDLLETLLADHESEVAALIETGLFIDRRAEGRDAALRQPNNLFDDLLQVVAWTAQEPGLLEAVLRALSDPRTARLGQIYGEMMRFRDVVGPDPARPNRARRNMRFVDAVDGRRPDEIGNTSLQQRTLAVIHDLNGVRMCNKEGARLGITVPLVGYTRLPGISFGECELFEIENIAETYSQAIVGRADIEIKSAFLSRIDDLARTAGLSFLTVDALLESESGIEGFTTSPTPEAMNRLTFGERNAFLNDLLGPVLTRDGVDVAARHPGVVFAWEREYVFSDTRPARRITFYEAMTPLLEAFDDFDRRTTGDGIAPTPSPTWNGERFLFGEMISALHLHYASTSNDDTQRNPAERFFSYQSGAVTYEENVADALVEGELVLRLHDLAVALEGVEVRPGVDGIAVLARATEQLVDPDRNAGLRARDGRATTTVNDGTRTVELTPLYLILDGLAAMDDAFDAAPDRHAPWLDARSALVDQFLEVDGGGGSFRFRNRRGLAAIRTLLSFLRGRVRAHRDAGDIGEWAATFAARAESSLGGPLGASVLRFVDAVQRDDQAREELAAVLGYLVDEAAGDDAFDTAIVSAADLLQVLDDDRNVVPLLHALSEGIADDARRVVREGGELSLDGSALDATMQLLREINAVDDERILKEIMANLVALPPGEQETPLEVIIDVIAEVNRTEPGAGTPMNVSDYREVFDRTSAFFRSETRGMERMYDVMQERALSR